MNSKKPSEILELIRAMNTEDNARISKVEQDPDTFVFTFHINNGFSFSVSEEDVPQFVSYLRNRRDRIMAIQRNLEKRSEILQKKIKYFENQVDFLDEEEK